MANNLEFLLKLQDLLSPAMKQAQLAADSAAGRIQQDMNKVEVSAAGASRGVSLLRSGLSLLAPLVGAFASFEFLKGSVEMYNEAAQAQAQLRASLQSTHSIAGLTSKELEEQAASLQRTTLFDDDATVKMQALLLTFTNIRGKIFTEAVPAIQDLATKMGGDLQGAAVQVGKALNNPIEGLTALKRVGVSFSEAQRDVIKRLVDTGHTAEAQTLILRELNTEFGGSAAAAAKAGTGPFTVLQNKFHDVREEIGRLIVRLGSAFIPVIQGLINVVEGTVIGLKSFYHWVQANSTALEVLSGAIIAGAAAYEVYILWSQRAVIWSGIKKAAAIIEMGAMVALGTAIEFVNAMFIATPIGWIVVGIALLVGWIIYLVKNFEGWGKQWDSLMKFSKFTWASFKDYFSLVWLQVQDAFMNGIEFIERGWYHLKSLWDEDGAAAGLSKINNTQNQRAAEILRAKGLLSSDSNSATEALKLEIHRNDKNLGTVVSDLKKKLGLGGGGINPATANGAGTFAATKGAAGAGLGDVAKGKSEGINSGGQRSIIINIGKQIEKLEVHVMDAKEGVNEIESMVRDAMRRVVYSMNGVAS